MTEEPNKLVISQEMIWNRAERVASDIAVGSPTNGVRMLGTPTDQYRVYGVPRAGSSVAYAVAGQLQARGISAMPVSKIEGADIIVDDLVDSGTTRETHNREYPGIPFFALYDKQKEPNLPWLVFPWESADGNPLGSAEDIPRRLLQFIGEDPTRGGLVETPQRFLKAWGHWTSGYQVDIEKDVLKVFEDGAEECDEMIIVRGIHVYSHCEHHLAPFFGEADVAYIPNKKILGLSKINRLVDAFARRLQVQERLTNQVASTLMKALDPLGVAVQLRCRHMCMESRGVAQPGSYTITSATRGAFRTNAETRAEFMSVVGSNHGKP